MHLGAGGRGGGYAAAVSSYAGAAAVGGAPGRGRGGHHHGAGYPGRGGRGGRGPPREPHIPGGGAPVAPGANLRQSIVPSEDFDFAANMEKFNKEQLFNDYKGGDPGALPAEAVPMAAVAQVAAVYEKDDFFDMMSCEALERLGLGGDKVSNDAARLPPRLLGRSDLKVLQLLGSWSTNKVHRLPPRLPPRLLPRSRSDLEVLQLLGSWRWRWQGARKSPEGVRRRLEALEHLGPSGGSGKAL
eukprot:56731-Prorocentrum_minimum.AAC.5